RGPAEHSPAIAGGDRETSPDEYTNLPPPPAPPPRRGRGLLGAALHLRGKRLPLAEGVHLAAGRQRVELEQGEGVVEGLAEDEAERGALVGGRLEQAPHRLQRLFDLVA